MESEHITVVAAGVLVRDGRYFLAKRSAKAYDGAWEFPGGKYEPGEEWVDAIKREWVEELDCQIAPGSSFFIETFSTAEGKKFLLVAGFVHPIGGLLPRVGKDHSESAWLTWDEAMALKDVVPSTKPILRAIIALAVEQPSSAGKKRNYLYLVRLRERVAFVPKGQALEVSQEEYDACVASLGEENTVGLSFMGRPLRIV